MLGRSAQFKILLGISINNLAQQLCKLCSMLCLFKGVLGKGSRNFRITLTIGLTAHRKIHTNLGAFAGEVAAQSLQNLGVTIFSNTDLVLICKYKTLFCNLVKLTGGYLTLRTELRGLVTFMNITTNATDKFFHFSFLHIIILFLN
ncbi:hypothetical protein SDC9_163745 [bioreactor metagenome]|uniref:Uncharacterized protein n=1 Tax=bioreactor metagenome TaxID=1076179 RepID=A0A645FPR4_9ZZZZ